MSSIANPLTAIPLTATAPSTTTNSTAKNVTDPLANESTFLTLLVSQLQNQDPLNPTDSNQFVTQLTGYSQLEQLIGIHNNTTSLANAVTDPTTTGTTPPTTTTPTTTGN
jgi:flagellar basal-body rod modification protein FlgD